MKHVTRVNLAATRVIVPLAPLVIFRIPKAKTDAVTRASRLEKYLTKRAQDANHHRGVRAKWANI